MAEKKRGKRSIIVRSESGIEREHLVTHNKHLRVHSGDIVRAGDALVDGPLVPHDILRISGEEAVQQYLTREIQNVYRSQRVEINDKHIEIIVARMLRKVRIEHPGDTNLLPGSVMDKFDFRQANEQIMQCLKITEKGDSEFADGSIVPKDVLEQANAQIEALGGDDRQGHEAEAGHREHAALGHHQGVGAKLQLHLGRQLPGNDEGAHRSGARRPDRSPRRPQGERHPRPLDPGRHRLPQHSRSGSSHSARSARSPGGRERPRARTRVPAVGIGRRAAERGQRRWCTRTTSSAQPAPTSLDALLGGAEPEDADSDDA